MNSATNQLRRLALLDLDAGVSTERIASLYKTLKSEVDIPINPYHPRVVNHFKVGCDPEFILSGPTEVIAATGLGLRTQYAYGCDGSGTQVELRAHPNQSVVWVVASLLNTMRAMLKAIPATRSLDWLTGGYVHDYSCGGHVHFGRKSRLREEEVVSLDKLAVMLGKLGLTPGQDSRTKRSRYGHFRDWRHQTYGYEYRVFPSWLFSPRFAHFVLTLAKLSVYDLDCWPKSEPANIGQRIENILAFYRFLDDDAALAYKVWKTRGTALTSSFKAAWGLSLPASLEQASAESIRPPSTIQPDSQSIKEAYDSIRTGEPPKMRVPIDFSGNFSRNIVIGHPSFGFIPESHKWNSKPLYIPKGLDIRVEFIQGANGIYIGPKVFSLLQSSEVQELKRLVPDWKGGLKSNITADIIGFTKFSLCAIPEGHLPIATPFRLTEEFAQKWLRRTRLLKGVLN